MKFFNFLVCLLWVIGLLALSCFNGIWIPLVFDNLILTGVVALITGMFYGYILIKICILLKEGAEKKSTATGEKK